MIKAVHPFVSSILLIVAWGFLPPSTSAQQVPEQLQPPSGQILLFRVHAKGDQIYFCKAEGAQFAWTLKAPEAQLFSKDGEPFGRHFVGPSWQANDGSRVTGQAAASAPSPNPDSIPWLLVTVTGRSGKGVLARVTSIQRLNTKGGKPSTPGCDAAHLGQEQRVPYSADYLFFVPR
jgi:Protein of unknown function (DUF3455)